MEKFQLQHDFIKEYVSKMSAKVFLKAKVSREGKKLDTHLMNFNIRCCSVTRDGT